MNNFSSNLKYLRESYHLNQKQLGDRLKKDYSTIGKWENGTRSPTMEDTLEVCKFFNISLNDLITSNLIAEEEISKNDFRNEVTQMLNNLDADAKDKELFLYSLNRMCEFDENGDDKE